MTARQRAVFEIVIGTMGFAVLIASAGWQTALGVFLVLWANNLRRPDEAAA